jgi:hypothetical protein
MWWFDGKTKLGYSAEQGKRLNPDKGGMNWFCIFAGIGTARGVVKGPLAIDRVHRSDAYTSLVNLVIQLNHLAL